MKIILTGTTGFVGQEVLSQCLAHPSITSIVALSRRDLPIANTNPKLQVYLMQDQDFLSYSDPQLQEMIRGAGACIWSLGVTPFRASDKQAFHRATVDFTAKAAEAFNEAASSSEEPGRAEAGKRFRFVYLSGGLAERDQSRSLWLSGDYRRVRGEAENVLLAQAAANPGFESYIMRPAMVLSKNGTISDYIRGLAPSVRVDVLARAALNVAVNGNQERLLENSMMTRWAK